MRSVEKDKLVLAFQFLRPNGSGSLAENEAVLREAVEAQTHVRGFRGGGVLFLHRRIVVWFLFLRYSRAFMQKRFVCFCYVKCGKEMKNIHNFVRTFIICFSFI